MANNTVQRIHALSAADVERLKASPREGLATDRDGRIAYMTRANTVKGRVPR